MGRFHRHGGERGSGGARGHGAGRPDHRHPGPGEPVAPADRDHSGYATSGARVSVLEAVFAENDRTAAANRADVDAAGVRMVNLMSAPGAGKTTLLHRTLRELAGRLRVGVVEGDIETSLDADRLAGLGATVALVNTGAGFGGECHLDAPMVRRVLPRLPLAELDLVVIENVGNLVCPAEFDVGAHARAMVCAVTEGEDKPLKYPVMFRAVELVVINKIDLLPHLDFSLPLLRANVRAVNPAARVLELSARTGAGLGPWLDWLVGAAGGRQPAPPVSPIATAG